jgi:hypothetical protein
MTSKHYRTMAEILRQAYQKADMGKEKDLIEILIKDIAKVYATDNHRFNPYKFYTACGW